MYYANKEVEHLKPVKLVNVIKIDVYTCVMLTDEPREKALERHKRWKTYQPIGQLWPSITNLIGTGLKKILRSNSG